MQLFGVSKDESAKYYNLDAVAHQSDAHRVPCPADKDPGVSGYGRKMHRRKKDAHRLDIWLCSLCERTIRTVVSCRISASTCNA